MCVHVIFYIINFTCTSSSLYSHIIIAFILFYLWGNTIIIVLILLIIILIMIIEAHIRDTITACYSLLVPLILL